MVVEPLVLCLGVPKAATTWVHRQLEAHPEVACTTTKEVGYWMRNYHRGPKWYASQFAPTEQTRVFAEVTPHYLNERALGRAATDVRDVRFLVVLRDPYERAHSDYLNALRNGEVRGTFAQAVQIQSKILKNSLYGEALSTYQRFFPLDRLHIIMYEDIVDDPGGVVERLYRFMGVNAGFSPAGLGERVNAGRDTSAADLWLKRLERLGKRFGLTRKHLIMLGLDGLLDGTYRRLASRHPPRGMTQADRGLLAPTIEPDITTLEGLLRRDLSHWRARRPTGGDAEPD